MDDNTFECPNCGATIYPEMSRCPRCGQNMYPEDEEETLPAITTASVGWGTFLGALLVGWMIASGIALIIHFAVAAIVPPAMLGWFGTAILLVAGPLGAFTGGYVGAGIAKYNHKLLGILLGLLVLPLLAVFATHWVQVTLKWFLNPWIIAAALLTVLAGLLGAWAKARSPLPSDWREKWKVRGWEDLLYQDLLRKVRFNGSTADRLIDYERKQDPQATRLKLIQNAIERWERDNR